MERTERERPGEVMRGTLAIRADAGVEMGTGHVMRCLALGQAWKDAGGEVIFITGCRNAGLLGRLRDEGFRVHVLEGIYPDPRDWASTRRILAETSPAWIALDGYHFDETYQRRMKEAGHRLLVIDDLAHLSHYYADVVLNQNLHAEELRYSCESDTRLLLGTRYVLLRHEFLRWQEWRREIPEVARKMLVTLGGSDPNNITLKAVQALELAEMKGLEVVVVVGGSNPHQEKLQAAVRNSRLFISLETNVTNMSDLMASADMAIAAAGTTVWEMAFMGLPGLVLALAENQRLVAERLNEAGVALNLGWYEELPYDELIRAVKRLSSAQGLRAEMAHRGRRLVDGEGAARLLMHLKGERLRLRRARPSDCRLLWEWANDRAVRAVSFSTDPIPWEDHVKWFISKLHDPNCFLFIGVDEQDLPVGQVRFEIMGKGEAEIHLSIDRHKRGLGYGSSLIRMGLKEIFHLVPVNTIRAFIKPNNQPSIKAFEKVGFKRLGTEVIKGNRALHYVYRGGPDELIH